MIVRELGSGFQIVELGDGDLDLRCQGVVVAWIPVDSEPGDVVVYEAMHEALRREWLTRQAEKTK